jgi:hypothetical protein
VDGAVGVEGFLRGADGEAGEQGGVFVAVAGEFVQEIIDSDANAFAFVPPFSELPAMLVTC